MPLSRRELFGLLGVGSFALLTEGVADTGQDLQTWEGVRDLFDLDRSKVHMAGLLLASHPAPVRKLIEEHRKAFDRNPVAHWHDEDGEPPARASAGRYLETSPNNIALTDSTTMGLAMLYNGVVLKDGQEFLTTEHDHQATHQSLNFRSRKTGHQVRRIALFESSAKATREEILDNLRKGIQPTTRVVAATWVHSSTGMKLPIAEMSKVVAEVNRDRSPEDAVLFCVDGVHGFGNQDVSIDQLGCDFFAAGTHKWMFGPRGTGILYGRPSAQKYLVPTIPSFSSGIGWGHIHTPGGFHSFEHRWALSAAFDLHMAIGKSKIAARITALNTRMKEGLTKINGLTLHTPMDPQLSGALVCFEVEGRSPQQVVDALATKGIIASTTPYRTSYARVTPGLLNSEDDVDRTIAAIAGLR